ncbi:MAG: saccharopine dehydrogenase C-terminal domain-containing protein [Bacteroidota bacterium]
MKITVIGAGSIGSAIALDLVRRDRVSLVRVCDARARSLQEIHAEVDSSKLRSFQVDVRDRKVLESILKGSDAAIGCVPPEHSPRLARLCLSLGIAYCDLGGSTAVYNEILTLNEEARAKSVWIVPNCGLAPGLVNVLCLRGLSKFDEVETARLRVGDVPLHPEPPFNFRISWTAQKVIEDYTHPTKIIANGDLQARDALTGLEQVHFEAPFNTMEAFHTSGGLSSLAEDLEGEVQRLDYKTIRWPGHADQMRFLLALGFGDDRHIDVRTHLTYRDVLVRRLRQRLGGEYADAALMRLLFTGTVDGAPKTLVYEMVKLYDSATQMSAMRLCTGVPVALVAYLLASGQVTGGGAAPPERVVPLDLYCDLIHESGLPVTMRWYDGHLSITDTAVAQPTNA